MERQELLAQVWSFVDEKFRKLPLGSAWEGVKFAFCEAFVLCGCFGNMYTVLWLRFFLNLTEVFLTLTEGFPCFFLSCKANARVKLPKTGRDPQSSTLVCICVVRLLFVLFYVLFVCKCVLPPGDKPNAVNKYTIISYLLFQVGFTCFGRCFRQSSGALDCIYSIW